MRVLHVIPSVAQRYGGPSTAIWPMTAALRKLGGVDVEIATTDADGPSGRLTTADLPADAGVVHLFHRANGEISKYSPNLYRWLNSHARDYNLIHVHSNWNYPATSACRAAHDAGVPYVIRPCGMLSAYTLQRSKWKKRAYWWLRERNNVFHAAGFHATSNDEREDLLRLGVTVSIDVIPLGIGNEAWETPIEPNWLRQQCPNAGNRPILLFLSRLHPKKGIVDLLLPALHQMEKRPLLALVGGEDDHAPGYLRQIQLEVTRLHLEDSVTLLGPVPSNRRWAAFDGADLFVLPSHSENFGIVVAEAMARGKPVVVTSGVQFGCHVTASGAGDVVSLNSGDLSASLTRWLSSPALRSQAGEVGCKYVRNQLTWQRTAEQLMTLYHRLKAGAECSSAIHLLT